MSLHRILIVGGGAGGLELATLLGNKVGKKKQAQITLVDANMTHLWKPRLHEVAAGVLNADVDELNYVAHGKRHHFNFVMGRMSGLDRANKQLILAPHRDNDEEILPERRLPYDQLVIAIGSNTNDFGTKGAADHCIFLDRRKAAEDFHRKFLYEFLLLIRPPESVVLNHQLVVELMTLCFLPLFFHFEIWNHLQNSL